MVGVFLFIFSCFSFFKIVFHSHLYCVRNILYFDKECCGDDMSL